MRHTPHLLLPGPWPAPVLPLDPSAAHHVTRVLRLRPGAALTYTDGAGTVGEGRLETGGVVRGPEHRVGPSAPRVVLAVAPPRDTARARYVVEKAAELGVAEVRWVTTVAGQAPAPRAGKSEAWAAAGLEQSRGAWITSVSGPVAVADLGADTVLAHPGAGAPDRRWWEAATVTLLVGPEGGLSDGEAGRFPRRLGLGERVLRTETAAVVAAALVLAAGRERLR